MTTGTMLKGIYDSLSLTSQVNVVAVNGGAVLSVDDFKADLTLTNSKIDDVQEDVSGGCDDAAVQAKLDELAVAIAALPIDELTAEQHVQLMSLVNTDLTDINALITDVPTAAENATELLERVI